MNSNNTSPTLNPEQKQKQNINNKFLAGNQCYTESYIIMYACSILYTRI